MSRDRCTQLNFEGPFARKVAYDFIAQQLYGLVNLFVRLASVVFEAPCVSLRLLTKNAHDRAFGAAWKKKRAAFSETMQIARSASVATTAGRFCTVAGIKICIVVRMNALFRSSKQALQHAGRSFASGPHPERKVALLGAAGGIGQPLGLLLKVRILAAAHITSSSDVKI